MILIYSHEINHRVNYTLNQVFLRTLEIPISLTSSVDKFVNHSGPKLSYTHQPIANEFFVKSHTLLFEQGVYDFEICVENWAGIPAFFKTNKVSKIPYDIFASTFYLISRYEEFLPYIKDSIGSFKYSNSIAYKNGFLEKPIVDLWAIKLLEKINEFFPDLVNFPSKKPIFTPLISVVNPYKYKEKYFLFNFLDSLDFIWKLDFFNLIDQFLVIFGFKKDPYDNLQQLRDLFVKNKIKPKYFFLFAQNNYYDRGLSNKNYSYKKLIKDIADYEWVSLLVSYAGQNQSLKLLDEKKNMMNLIYKKIKSIRFNYGLLSSSTSYNELINQEIQNDFSMGYNEETGYRASTAVPFYFYDLNIESQTPLKLYPVVATEKSLRKFSAKKAFKKLERMYEFIPTGTGVHIVSFSNSIISEDNNLENWYYFFKKYLDYHAK